MKKYVKSLMIFAFMLFSSTVLFAQDNVLEYMVNGEEFTEVFTTFVTLVAVIPVVTEFLKNAFKVNGGTPKFLIQLLSWGTGILLTMFGWWFSLGFLAGLEWYYALLYGFGASLASNGVADTKIIQWIFSLFIKK